FSMPAAAGTYELRLFPNGAFTHMATSGSITVAVGAPPTLSVNTTSAKAGASVTASWGGVTGATTNDWIGVFHPGDADTAYLDFEYDSSCTKTPGSVSAAGSCGFPMPATAGTYELRLFSNGGFTRLAVSGPITVTP